MSANNLKNILLQSDLLNKLIQNTQIQKEVFIKGLVGSLKALFLSILAEKTRKQIIYVTSEDDQEEVVKEDLEVLVGHDRVAYFPRLREFVDKDTIFDSNTKSLLLAGLEKLIERKQTINIISAKTLAHKFPAPVFINKQRLFLEVNKEYSFEKIKERLIDLGFVREYVVENWGEMSVRGGIIDLYPYSSEYPYRIEFFGDTIESIRIFDPTTQRSQKQIPCLTIYPQFPDEQEGDDIRELSSFFDYFDESTIIYFDEIELIKKTLEESFDIRRRFLSKSGSEAINKINDRFLTWEEIEKKTKKFNKIIQNSFQTNGQVEVIDFSCQAQESLRGDIKLLRKKIDYFSGQKTTAGKSYQIFFLCDSKEQIERLRDLFMEMEIDLQKLELTKLGLNQGFVFRESGIVVFTDNQFYGRPIRWRRRKKIRRGLTLQQLNSLSIGDFVVHIDKGVGIYRGLKKINVQGHERECLSIEYRDKDMLYVPLERMDRIQKYSAKEGVVPTLTKLGTRDWERIKKKTKKRIKEIAKELTILYAKRKIQPGFAFSKDNLWQKELEASFEYEDTSDQYRATEEIKADMETPHPMDRLVCGDVGYGKTEVAVRAAFKAVMDNKQVAILVPTTILALQHYELFRERLKKYPINIEMLSRFRTRSVQKQIIEKLKQGKIDIIIGTHRLLSKDVDFKDMGLLIVDEEHRFGVKKKERLKEKYLNVDVLSMSATPIPRTLNMALLGIRDMSLIATPPLNRHPIHTEIAAFNLDLIRMAILKEADRGGQVFFVHNRVQTIDSMANLIRRTVPEISIAVAHGQMDERELEKIMWDFATKKYQCLVSTMIIESGLDIPNVNTLIINRADRFGLSQLYQLRGRVGRSSQKAYAYFLVPSIRSLTKNALKRLRIIEEFNELGSGFNIAMRDLEIRGAGNIFGAEQSGHVLALGFDLYTKIIEEAMNELKLEQEGKPIPEEETEKEIRVEIDEDAYLPDTYISHPEFKVDIYRRLANEKELAEIEKIREEVIDRFGKFPGEVSNLFNLVELKLLGKKLDFRLIKIQNHQMICYFSDQIVQSNNRELIQKKVSSIIVKANGKFQFVQGKNEGFGIKLEIPEIIESPINYSKNFLKNLI